ncbi:hypothetical protein QAD02_017954 [Eretmocerus hayati]|uniref:Uncharacterized protein n=1 Tax=Eretmocerus hayati TaxID=131215 RepID=A0ACC2PFQ2_9HYME|nr:hypothetical protein QAD02_017954 [Eretmocerus hayati]
METCLDETELAKRYMRGIKEFTKVDQDPPCIPCISCERLCTSKYTDRVEKHIIESNSKYFALKSNNNLLVSMLGGSYEQRNDEKSWWERLQDLHEPENFRNSFICHHCIGKFKLDQLPSLCVLNNLFIDNVPIELQTLNRFEKMLIQRAKAFQVVVKLETVQKKNIPHYMKLDQVKGRTFYLPLPLEATLEKICKETDPINLNHEMYVLVRSNPTKKKVVWEDYVSIKKVWLALGYLIDKNPLYANIKLPSTPEELLKIIEQADLEYVEGQVDAPHDGARIESESSLNVGQTQARDVSDNAATQTKKTDIGRDHNGTLNGCDEEVGGVFIHSQNVQPRDDDSHFAPKCGATHNANHAEQLDLHQNLEPLHSHPSTPDFDRSFHLIMLNIRGCCLFSRLQGWVYNLDNIESAYVPKPELDNND